MEQTEKHSGKPRAGINRYRLITVKMWDDDRFKELSKPKPNAQTLWIYLLTGQHTTAFPGVFVSGEAALAEALEWSLSSFKKVFKEILDRGMSSYDKKHRLIYLPKAVLHNPPQSPNVVIAWRKVFDLLPDCTLKAEIYKQTISNLQALGLGEAFTKAFGKDFQEGSGHPSPNQEQDSGTGLGNKIQETGILFPESPSKPSKSLVPENERATPVENDPRDPEFRKRLWAPIERGIRSNVDPDIFAKYYAGCEIRELTKTAVVVAVPDALIQRNGGSCGEVGLLFADTARRQRFDLFKDRKIVVVVQEDTIP